MYKKLLITLSIIISLNSLAGEVDDIKYISRLYGSEEYQLSANEAEKFLYKYPNSKQYNTIRNILGQSFYRIGNFTRAEEIFESLINKAEFSEDAIFYLAMINIENSNFQKIDKIIISDFTGKTILEANENTNQLNLENLEVGVYIINISSNGKSNKMKIIKK